jgi:glycosyltransferase involved in cell wall biosynthesis
MIEASIIIPFYNSESTIRRCIESAIVQRGPSIEILCVDDGSRDNSKGIVEEYARCDVRIKLFSLTNNRGTGFARKVGALESRGKFVFFLDSDDELFPDAIDKLCKKARLVGADILQFMPNLKVDDYIGDEERKLVQSFISPYCGYAYGLGILRKCFLDHSFAHHLWNKVFLGDLIRRAFKDVPDERMVVSEDYVTFFMIACHAKTYYGESVEGYYLYHYGRGISSKIGDVISAKRLRDLCNTRAAYESLVLFAKNYPLIPGIDRVLREVRFSLFQSSLSYARKFKDSLTAYGILLRYWRPMDVFFYYLERVRLKMKKCQVSKK